MTTSCRMATMLATLFVGITVTAVGQVPVSGNLADGAGGPLMGGVVYHATGPLVVPAGMTLTIQAGAILKFPLAGSLSVAGHLDIQGSSAQPVILTELDDDGAGGDTNGNGPSSGSPGSWVGLSFAGGSTGSVVGMHLRFGGRASLSAVDIQDADVALVDCSVRDCQAAALDLNGFHTMTSVTGCAFDANGSAVREVSLTSVPSFSNNTATGNAISNSILVEPENISSSIAIGPSNMLSGTILLTGPIVIAAGADLTLGAGCILKWSTVASSLTINGSLHCNGTAANPVVFTEIKDDSFGGDSNLDGPSMGVPGFWNGISFTNTVAPSALTNTRVRYAGRSGFAALEVTGTPLFLTNCAVDRSLQACLDLNDVPAFATVTGCSFSDSGRAVIGVPLASLGGMVSNVAAGNTVHDTIAISSGSITSGTIVITAANMLSGAILVGSNIDVATGATLNLGPGCVFKFSSVGLGVNVDGTLVCAGSPAQPVVFTEARDDSFGGDTNHDGATSPSPGFWSGLSFNAGSLNSSLAGVRVRFGGRNAADAIAIAGDLWLRDSIIESCQADGISLNGGTAQPMVEDCMILGCLGTAIDELRWSSLAGFRNNTASGNGDDFARITSPLVGSADRVFAHNYPGGALVVGAAPLLGAGTSLVLEAGVVVKMETVGTSFDCTGGVLEVRGTGLRPVTMTEIKDDLVGGDTNGDGPSSGVQGFWRGVSFSSGAQPALVDHLVIRHGGRNATTAFVVDSPVVKVRDLEVARCQSVGARIDQLSGDATNWIVRDCLSDGIQLAGDSARLLHATVTGNSGAGIRKLGAAWTGSVRNTISWGNVGANFSGLGISELFSSDGDSTLAGSNGNIFADPAFVSAATGDLTLAVGSPCLDVADVAIADLIRSDHREASRRADDDLSGAVLPDMGAFERISWHLGVQGDARIDSAQVFTLTGPSTGLGAILLAGINGDSQFYVDYGWLLIGFESEVLLIATLPPNQPLIAPIPDLPALIGFPFQVQGIVVSTFNTTRGNFTERYRAKIAP